MSSTAKSNCAKFLRCPMKFDSVTDDRIVTLVDSFYARIREDAELGPVFEDVVAGHWDKHLTTMYRFWSSVMLKTGTYHGSPMQAHMRIPGLEPHLFPRWLTLFEQTVSELPRAQMVGVTAERQMSPAKVS